MKGSVAAWVFAAVVSATGLPAAAQSQDGQVWIQIEARNNRAAAEERLGTDGRVLVRPSGTEPLVRVMVEAVAEGLAQEVADGVAAVVRTELAIGAGLGAGTAA